MQKFNQNSSIETKISSNYIDYFEALDFMENRVSEVINNKKKELIWFLNHNHVYTCGTSSNPKEILKTTNIPIIKTNRGGKTTYHGPGQRVVYMIINLNNRKKDLRNFIQIIEDTIIEILKNFNIQSQSYSDRIGLWVTKNQGIQLKKEQKIAAIGLRIKKWVTYHGLSFNINPDLSYYNNISACGLVNYSSTSLKELGINIKQEKFDELFIMNFEKKLKIINQKT